MWSCLHTILSVLQIFLFDSNYTTEVKSSEHPHHRTDGSHRDHRRTEISNHIYSKSKLEILDFIFSLAKPYISLLDL
jgi:hypothetical protein